MSLSFGELLHEHWEHKKRRSGGMSNPQIDEWYELGMKHGAVGGKLVGAGGGGFLMFYASDRNKLRHVAARAGLEEVRFRFDFEAQRSFYPLDADVTRCDFDWGLAIRLRPVTETIPKALVDVAGKPFVVRQLDYLRHQGVPRVVLCVGYLGEQVEAVVGDGSAYGLEVRYSWDGPTLLGTGGAIKRALPKLGPQFLCFTGIRICLSIFRRWSGIPLSSGKPALMTVLRNADRWDKSNVEFEDGNIIEYNKRAPRPEMAHIDYGLGCCQLRCSRHADQRAVRSIGCLSRFVSSWRISRA